MRLEHTPMMIMRINGEKERVTNALTSAAATMRVPARTEVYSVYMDAEMPR